MSARFLTALAFAGLCLAASVNAAPTDNFLIVPGHSIGQTALGPNGAAELKSLPIPAAGDNGMMQTHNVYVSHRSGRTDTLYIHTVANGALGVKPADGVTIDTVRVTSPQFHTQSGISTRSTLAEVRRRFPHLHADRFNPQIYSDVRRGIVFEFTRPLSSASCCLAISVFPPGGDIAETTQSQVNGLLKDARTDGEGKSKQRGQEQALPLR